MRKNIVILLVLCCTIQMFGQEDSKLIVSSFEHFYKTIDVSGKSVLENQFRKERVEYVKDDEGYHCIEYFRETHSNQSNGDSISSEKTLTKPRRWKNSISNKEFSWLKNTLKTDSKSLGGVSGMLYTSHHRFYVYFTMIENGDTTTWRKTKPFEVNTAWENLDQDLMIVDPEIDKVISKLMPRRFNGRKEILSTTTGIPNSPASQHTAIKRYAFAELQCIP